MKWKDFRSYMNLFFDDNDEIRITTNNELPVIELVPKNDDDSGYSVIINSLDDEYFVWDCAEMTEFVKCDHSNDV